jgi:endoglucanase
VILKVLEEHQVKASFFLTGNFYRNSEFHALIRSLKKSGHYLGPHSDKHLLYADWNNRDSLLVTHSEFKNDLHQNYERMKRFNITQDDASYFVPPYEWYNAKIVDWARAMGVTVVNFTPGTLSTADYTIPEMKERYRSSDTIYNSIINFERSNENGMNGFILLIHIGTDPRRTDKLYNHLDSLLLHLKDKGYAFLRIDKLLR